MGKRGPQPLTADEHKHRGTFRADRHDRNGERIDEHQVVSPAARRRVLVGLPRVGAIVARDLLDAYWDWPPEALHTLRAYAFSSARLAELQERPTPNHAALAHEVTTNVTLLRALNLPPEDEAS